MSKNIHVTLRSDSGQWAVKTQGAEKAAGLFQTQAEAIAAAREIAVNRKGELFIHDKGGRIRDRDSFGNDPHPPTDRRH